MINSKKIELKTKVEKYLKDYDNANSLLNQINDIDKMVEKIESIDLSKDLKFNVKFSFLSDKKKFIKQLLSNIENKRELILAECEKV